MPTTETSSTTLTTTTSIKPTEVFEKISLNELKRREYQFEIKKINKNLNVLILEQNDKGKEVYILDATAALYMIPKEKYNKEIQDKINELQFIFKSECFKHEEEIRAILKVPREMTFMPHVEGGQLGSNRKTPHLSRM